MLWPAYGWHLTTEYPGPIHARIMIEGFLTCFIIGFLGTALPRLLGATRITLGETLGFAVALLGVVVLQASGSSLGGDMVFLGILLALITGMAFRAATRRDNPPPAFLLAALGMLCALIGVTIQIILQAASPVWPAWVAPLGRLLLYQGFVLLPVMGVGAFLLPRFFGLPNRQNFPESLTLSPEWKRRASFALACGALVLASFALEALGLFRTGYGLRAGAVVLFFYHELPLHQAKAIPGSLALGLKIALASIPLGYALMTIFPDHALTFLHVVFISGFSLMVFIVASRVIFGHSGQMGKFQASIWPVFILFTLLPLAMLTRVSSDWMPNVRFDHYAYAAIAWTVGVGIWALTILPQVRKPDAP